MKDIKRLERTISFKKMAAICPNCLHVDDIGDIAITVEVSGEFDKEPEVNYDQLLYLSNNMNDNEFTNPAIVFTCKWCNHPVIIIDKSIAPCIQALWSAGYVTTASCDGNSGYCYGYVTIQDNKFGVLLNKLREKYTEKKYLEDGESIYFEEIPNLYFDLPYHSIREMYKSKGKFVNNLTDFIANNL